MRLLATPKNVTTTSYTHIAVVRCFGSGFVNCFCLAYVGHLLMCLAHFQMDKQK